jgi:hypothetical protein
LWACHAPFAMSHRGRGDRNVPKVFRHPNLAMI